MIRRAVGKALQRPPEGDTGRVEVLKAQVNELEDLVQRLGQEVETLRAELAKLRQSRD